MSEILDQKLKRLPKAKQKLWAKRHTAEHVLTQAMLSLYKGLKMAMGPATEDGFYFDFDYDGKITEEDFPIIEKEMQKIVDQNLPLKKKVLAVKDARKLFRGNKYKKEWLDEIEKRGEKATVYWTSNVFVDLCAGPHVNTTGEIGAFKLLSIAGAYWRGDEKNKMLTRIYGTSFHNQKELKSYLKRLEEARKHDHRRIGKDLDLFIFSKTVGKGLPLFTPKGSIIRRELERFIVDEEIKKGYSHVYTPHLANVALFKKSGHYPYYKDSMYPIMEVDDEKLILRPMTCPHHFELYLSKPRSYKELPLRIAELASQFRYEKSGELTGLIRARLFCLADAHIICKKDQAKDEINDVLALIDFVAKTLGFKKRIDYKFRLSKGNRKDTKKYYKDDKAWDFAESILRKALIKRKAPYYEAEDEAAFYGPKIDVQMKNTLGKEETAFTVQYDFVMPKRFNLVYIDKDGNKKEAVVIHRSSVGALERVVALLIEKHKGAFPVWLAPVQAIVLPITKRNNKFAKSIEKALLKINIRANIDDRNETLQAKIRDAQIEKIPYMLIVGDKEESKNKISLRLRNEKDLGLLSLNQFIKRISKKIEDKSLDL